MKAFYLCLIFYFLNFNRTSASSNSLNELDNIDRLLTNESFPSNEIRQDLLEQIPDPTHASSGFTYVLTFNHPISKNLRLEEIEQIFHEQPGNPVWSNLHHFPIKSHKSYWSEVCFILWDKPWLSEAGRNFICHAPLTVIQTYTVKYHGTDKKLIPSADVLRCECRFLRSVQGHRETFMASPNGDSDYFIYGRGSRANILTFIDYLTGVTLPALPTIDNSPQPQLIVFDHQKSARISVIDMELTLSEWPVQQKWDDLYTISNWHHACRILWDKPRSNQAEKYPVCTANTITEQKFSFEFTEITISKRIRRRRTADFLGCDCHLMPRIPGPRSDYETFYATKSDKEYFIFYKELQWKLRIIDILSNVSFS